MTTPYSFRNHLRDVLIVDDEAPFLETVVQGLAAAMPSLHVLTASNGKTALEMLRTAALDLVITDLRMPEMDGFQLLERIQERKPSVDVIVMSVLNDSDSRRRLVGMGVRRFLEKPFDFSALLRMLGGRSRSAVRTVSARSARPPMTRHILVMETEATARAMTGLSLEERGHSVCLTAVGEEVVGRFIEARESGDPFDLLFLDLAVPGGMGGLEASRLIWEADPQVRIIALSDSIDDPVFRNYAAYGFCYALTKPYATAQLETALRVVRETERSMPLARESDGQGGSTR